MDPYMYIPFSSFLFKVFDANLLESTRQEIEKARTKRRAQMVTRDISALTKARMLGVIWLFFSAAPRRSSARVTAGNCG
jgi:hypothetical protein